MLVLQLEAYPLICCSVFIYNTKTLSRLKFCNVCSYFLVEYDIPIFEKFGKGGTYPRRYHISYHQQDYNDGKCECCQSSTCVNLLGFF